MFFCKDHAALLEHLVQIMFHELHDNADFIQIVECRILVVIDVQVHTFVWGVSGDTPFWWSWWMARASSWRWLCGYALRTLWANDVNQLGDENALAFGHGGSWRMWVLLKSFNELFFVELFATWLKNAGAQVVQFSHELDFSEYFNNVIFSIGSIYHNFEGNLSACNFAYTFWDAPKASLANHLNNAVFLTNSLTKRFGGAKFVQFRSFSEFWGNYKIFSIIQQMRRLHTVTGAKPYCWRIKDWFTLILIRNYFIFNILYCCFLEIFYLIYKAI